MADTLPVSTSKIIHVFDAVEVVKPNQIVVYPQLDENANDHRSVEFRRDALNIVVASSEGDVIIFDNDQDTNHEKMSMYVNYVCICVIIGCICVIILCLTYVK